VTNGRAEARRPTAASRSARFSLTCSRLARGPLREHQFSTERPIAACRALSRDCARQKNRLARSGVYITDDGPDRKASSSGATLVEGNYEAAEGHNLNSPTNTSNPNADVKEDQRERYSAVWEYVPVPVHAVPPGRAQEQRHSPDNAQNATELFLQWHAFFVGRQPQGPGGLACIRIGLRLDRLRPVGRRGRASAFFRDAGVRPILSAPCSSTAGSRARPGRARWAL